MQRYKVTTKYGTLYTTAVSMKKAIANVKWRLRATGVYVTGLRAVATPV